MDVESLTKELLAYYFSISMHVCVLSRFSHVWLCDPVDGSLPGY